MFLLLRAAADVEAVALGALYLNDFAVVDDDLDDAETEGANLLRDDIDPSGFGRGRGARLGGYGDGIGLGAHGLGFLEVCRE